MNTTAFIFVEVFMKKLFVTILVIVGVFCLFGCNKGDETIDYANYVSFYQTHCYSGENEVFAVSVTAGEKEILFQADGVVGEMKNYVSIMLTPLNFNTKTENLSYTLVSASGESSGVFIQDKFSASLISDIESGDFINSIQSIKITGGDMTQKITLTNRLKDMLTWEEVLDISTVEMADYIVANSDKNGVFNKEICIKYIRNRNDYNSPYYWYVSYIGESFDFVAMLIDPVTGEIVTRK